MEGGHHRRCVNLTRLSSLDSTSIGSERRGIGSGWRGGGGGGVQQVVRQLVLRH